MTEQWWREGGAYPALDLYGMLRNNILDSYGTTVRTYVCVYVYVCIGVCMCVYVCVCMYVGVCVSYTLREWVFVSVCLLLLYIYI